MPVRDTVSRSALVGVARCAGQLALLLMGSAALWAQTPGAAKRGSSPGNALRLEPCAVSGISERVRCGTYWVYEDREKRRGRRIPLNIVVLPPRRTPAAADPVFSLYGGPGQTATEYAANEWDRWYRENREVVLVDQRGTGGPAPLECRLSGTEEDPQGYFEPMFQPALFRTCRNELARHADLRMYGTPAAADDLDEIRRALGYEKINLSGGSYGSRLALVYIWQHAAHVRSAILLALTPFSFKNPLFHARGAQQALDSLIAACRRQSDCNAAFPNVNQELQTVLERLARQPVTTTAPHPATEKSVSLTLGRSQFAEALRVMTYTAERASAVPLLIHRAFLGDFTDFARVGLASNYGLRSILRFGMLMSTTCSEDVARITEAEIIRETRGTFLGDDRVRQQIAACAEWPAARLPSSYAVPFRSSVPALLITGRYDPATPRRFGDEVKQRYLLNSMHLVIDEAGHSATSPCTDSISRNFLDRASLAGLDTSCVAAITLRPFIVPPTERR